MPDGRTHTLINACVTGMGVLTAAALGAELRDARLLLVVGGAVIGTLLISPDLDMLHVQTQTRKAWGPLRGIWYPLLLVSRHRGVSHSYLRGPLIRVTYLALMLTLLWLVASSVWGALGLPALHLPLAVQGLPSARWRLVLWVLLGYWLAQVAHLLADQIPLRWNRL